jgi:hypothetical protein
VTGKNGPSAVVQQKTALIGVGAFGLPASRPIRLLSDDDLYPYEVFIWNPATLDTEIKQFARNDTPWTNVWQSNVWDKFWGKFSARLAQIEKLVTAGATLIVIINSKFPEAHIHMKGSAKTIPVNSAPILNSVSLKNCTGVGAEFVCQTVQDAYQNGDDVEIDFRVEINGDNLKPIFRTHSKWTEERKTVGGYYFPETSKGCIIFTSPRANWQGDPNERLDFTTRMLLVADAQAKRSEGVAVPGWAEGLHISAEHEAFVRRGEIEKLQTELQIEAAGLDDSLARTAWHRDLYLADGDALVQAVKNAIAACGFQIVDGPVPRSDLVALVDNDLVVFEVGGHKGAARPYKATQLGGWIDDVVVTFQVPTEKRNQIHIDYAEILEKFGIKTPIEDSEEIPYKITIQDKGCRRFQHISR